MRISAPGLPTVRLPKWREGIRQYLILAQYDNVDGLKTSGEFGLIGTFMRKEKVPRGMAHRREQEHGTPCFHMGHAGEEWSRWPIDLAARPSSVWALTLSRKLPCLCDLAIGRG